MRVPTLLLMTSLAASAADPFVDAFKPRYETMKMNLVEAAEAMAPGDYSFKLSAQQRAFSEWVDHTVMLMHSSCSAMSGSASVPMDHSAHAGAKDKDALVKALKGAAAECDPIVAAMTGAKALAPAGPKNQAPVQAMLGLLTNMASHYGNMVGYLRAKGVTPPSTARGAKPASGK